jgi:hypothetical protein
MYTLSPEIKRDPLKRWNLNDRIFFGNGACHILAGTYLEVAPLPGFHAEWIRPHPGYSGNHIYVTDGTVAFDFHGYSLRSRLLDYHRRRRSIRQSGWDAAIVHVDFDLLDTESLNIINHLGPDQYLEDPRPRARRYLARMDQPAAFKRAKAIAER